MGRMDGKVVVVTGASSGIGRATFALLAREGAKVVGCARTQSTLDTALSAVQSAGGDGLVLSADLSKPEGADAIVKAALEAFGRIDALVNNAGVGWTYGVQKPGSMAKLHETTPDAWHDVLAINLDGYFYMAKAVLPGMLEQGGGSIVNVASMGGIAGLYDSHTYTAAKGAVVNLARSMAITYIKEGVRTNTVCPGFVDTPMIAPVMGAFDDPATAHALTPIGRAAQPEEIAAANLFFVSDESSYCNGSILVVDGGCTARGFPG